MKLTVATLFTVACLVRTAAAEVRLPKLFTDHAILQRDAPVHLWGWSSPDARLTLQFHAQTVKANADNLGHWSATLMP